VPSGHAPTVEDVYRKPEPPAPPPPPVSTSARLGPLCPRCTRLLDETPEESGRSCSKCGGVFLSHATLAARIEVERPTEPAAPHARHAHVPPEREVHYAWCPDCQKIMERMNFGGHSGIVVDVCRAHGTWFDRGELEAALTFVRAGGIEDDLAHAHGKSDAASEEARQLQGRLEATLRADTMREVADAEDFIWATGNLTQSLFLGGHVPHHLRRSRRGI